MIPEGIASGVVSKQSRMYQKTKELRKCDPHRSFANVFMYNGAGFWETEKMKTVSITEFRRCTSEVVETSFRQRPVKSFAGIRNGSYQSDQPVWA